MDSQIMENYKDLQQLGLPNEDIKEVVLVEENGSSGSQQGEKTQYIAILPPELMKQQNEIRKSIEVKTQGNHEELRFVRKSQDKVKKETSEDQKVQKKGIELNSELGDELGKELAQASLKEKM